MRYRLGEHAPRLCGEGHFIAPNAAVIGRVVMEENSSVWFACTLRADVEEIDALNILNATLLAMRRAVEALQQVPGRLRIDGNRAPELPDYAGLTETVVGGDRSCPAISAASILAKVARDREMLALDAAYPGYGFARHKGYPTAQHRKALLEQGACPAHRRSYRPVREALGLAAGTAGVVA